MEEALLKFSMGRHVEPHSDNATKAEPRIAKVRRMIGRNRSLCRVIDVLNSTPTTTLAEQAKVAGATNQNYFGLFIGDALCTHDRCYLQRKKITNDNNWIAAHARIPFLSPFAEPGDEPRVQAASGDFDAGRYQVIENNAKENVEVA